MNKNYDEVTLFLLSLLVTLTISISAFAITSLAKALKLDRQRRQILNRIYDGRPDTPRAKAVEGAWLVIVLMLAAMMIGVPLLIYVSR